jgi:tetratricopeptide (TPR) repeat protein
VGRLGVVCFSVGLAAALARVANADGDVEAQAKADIFFQKGQQDYQQNKFQAAIELFKDAYELVHDPVYLFNIAQSYRKAADCRNATDYYSKYLQESPNAPNTEIVKQWMRELAPCVEQQKRRELDAAKRAEQLAKQEREPKSVEPGPAQPTIEHDRGASLRTAGLLVGGVGVATLAFGVAETVRGRSLQSGLATACTLSSPCTYDQVKSLDDQGHRANTFATVGYIGGVVALAAGIGLYLYGTTKIEHVAISPAPSGATVGATFSW